MSLFSFVRRHGTTWRRPAVGRRPLGFRPGLEPLESRTVPSTLVTNLNDSGPGSLRAAVAAADATSGAVIHFAPFLHGTIKLTTGQLNLTSNMTSPGRAPSS